MLKVMDEVLIARLNKIYAKERKEEVKGIELLKKAWFFDKKDQAFYLRVMNGEKPSAFLHRVSDPSLL